MSDNKQYQDTWHDLLALKSNVDHAHRHTGLDSCTLELYQGFVRDHYCSALIKMFPRMSDVWDFNWNEISNEYFKHYAPTAWDLNDLAASFPDFLEKTQANNYLVELAQYELAEFQVYKSAKKEFSESPALQVNQTLTSLSFKYDIAGWVKQMDEWEALGEFRQLKSSKPLERQNIVLLVRNPETKLVVFTQPDMLSVGILEIIQQVEIANPLMELPEGLTHLFGASFAEKVSKEDIQASLYFLKQQSLVI